MFFILLDQLEDFFGLGPHANGVLRLNASSFTGNFCSLFEPLLRLPLGLGTHHIPNTEPFEAIRRFGNREQHQLGTQPRHAPRPRSGPRGAHSWVSSMMTRNLGRLPGFNKSVVGNRP